MSRPRNPNKKACRAAWASSAYAARVAAGLCVEAGCGSPPAPGKRRCPPCLECQRHKSKDRWVRRAALIKSGPRTGDS